MDNIKKTAQFLKVLGKVINVELLPYHRLGIGKYQTLDKPYPGGIYQTPSHEEMESVKKIFEDNGVACSIIG